MILTMKKALLATGLAAGILAAPPSFAETNEELVAASKGEQGLLLYSTGDAKSWETTIAAFNKIHPWIKVEVLELGGNELWERYRAEAATGVRTGDIAIGGSPHRFVEAYDRGDVLDYKPAGIEALPTFPDQVPGVYAIAVDPQVIIFNKVLLPENLWPKGFQDLAEKVAAHPEVFKGKVATFDPVTSSVGPGYNLATYGVIGDAAFWDSFEKLAPAMKFESGGTSMFEKVTSGEHLVAFFVGRYLTVSRLTGPRAQIVGWTYHDDAEPLQLRSMAVTKAASSPASAKLFADFLVSAEGQAAYGTSGSAPVHPDVADTDAVLTYKTLLEAIGGVDHAAYYGYSRKLFDYNKDFAPRINQLLSR